MPLFKYALGDKVQDLVSQFEGIITARTEWLNGCIRYTVRADKLNKDGEPATSQAFDEQELKLIRAGAVVIEQPEPRTGGDRPDVTRSEIDAQRSID